VFKKAGNPKVQNSSESLGTNQALTNLLRFGCGIDVVMKSL